MQRRAFCATGLAALTAASLPSYGALVTASDVPAIGLDGRQLGRGLEAAVGAHALGEVVGEWLHGCRAHTPVGR